MYYYNFKLFDLLFFEELMKKFEDFNMHAYERDEKFSFPI